MEHIDLINKIIEAERRAREVSEAALKRRGDIEKELAEKTSGLRESYYARADARIAKIKESEAALAAEQIEELDRVFDIDMETIETAYKAHKDEWADKLFKMIIE